MKMNGILYIYIYILHFIYYNIYYRFGSDTGDNYRVEARSSNGEVRGVYGYQLVSIILVELVQ